MQSLNSIPREINPLHQVRNWLDSVEIHNSTVAYLLCQIIPASCPFSREVKLFNNILFVIPPLCKLNPFYNQLMGLRFKSLVCLANQ
jgi:hypothetical protein